MYNEIREDIAEHELQPTNITILLSDRTIMVPLGVLNDVCIFIGPNVYPTDFVIVDMPRDSLCPIIFGSPFFVTTRARIDYKNEAISLKFGEEEIKIHFSNFKTHP